MLTAEGLTKRFGGVPALDDVSFRVAPHEVVALIGPNGAGKSTLFNVITGHLPPDAGRIWYKDREITGSPSRRLALQGLARSFQQANVFPRLSAYQNLEAAVLAQRQMNLQIWRRPDAGVREAVFTLLNQIGMQDQQQEIANEMSLADQKRLEFAMALAGSPELLLLDEPTAGLSATETRTVLNLIQRLHRENQLTILFTEHDMDFVFTLADRILVLREGRVLASGSPEGVRQNPAVQEAYLGVTS